MTKAQAKAFNLDDLLIDYTRALKLAVFDAKHGQGRWLNELVALGAERAVKYPTHAKGFKLAAAAARLAADKQKLEGK